jgi:hypothetical protein
MTDKELFIEEIIINSLKTLLSGRVNQLLGDMEDPIPPVEFGQSLAGAYAVAPIVRLSSSERTEKERIVRLDVYTLTITFRIPEGSEGERNCYAYAGAADRALGDDPTLGGAVNWAVLAGKKYDPPKQSGTGGDWEVVLTLRLTVEGGGYGG